MAISPDTLHGGDEQQHMNSAALLGQIRKADGDMIIAHGYITDVVPEIVSLQTQLGPLLHFVTVEVSPFGRSEDTVIARVRPREDI